MLLKNATYLDPAMRFRQGDILLDGATIASILAADTAPADAATDSVDCIGKLVLPGLINAHFHSQSNLGRGLFKGMGIDEWGNASFQGQIQERFFAYLDTGATHEEMRVICMKSYAELLHMGVTFTQDSGLAERPPEALVEAANAVGIRAFIDAYADIGRLHGRMGGRVQVGGHLPEEEDITDETLAEAVRARAAHDAIFMTHCLETKWRKDIVMKRYNRTTVALFAEHGLLNDRTVLFHGVEMTPGDIQILADHRTSLVHCPVSNLADVAPISVCLERGVNVCLGTDFGRFDPWEVMRTAYYVQKGRTLTHPIGAETVWRMATIDGARAYRMDDRIGIIVTGHAADLVFVDGSDTRLLPVVEQDGFSNRLHNLIMGCHPGMIRDVMIDGQWIIRDGTLITVDEEEIDAQFAAIARRIGTR